MGEESPLLTQCDTSGLLLESDSQFTFSIGMSEKREYAIAAYLALCRIFRIFQQSAHIAYFSAYFGIVGGNKYSL